MNWLFVPDDEAGFKPAATAIERSCCCSDVIVEGVYICMSSQIRPEVSVRLHAIDRYWLCW